jgi:hypothetical protein
MKFSLLKTVVACAAAIVVSPQLALAQSSWNVPNGAFDNPVNWNPNGVPGASDAALINNGGTSTFNVPLLEVDSLEIGSTGGASGTLAVTGGDLFAHGIRIGENGTGFATVNNGIMRTGNPSLFVGGKDGSGTGTLTISGNADTLVSSADDIGVGTQGTGTLNMSGGELQGVYTFIGKFGTGVWNHSGGLFRQTGGDVEIGDGGKPDQSSTSGPRNGTINLTGGVMQVWDSFCIGNRVGTGTVNISGGALTVTGGDAGNNNGNIYVGRGADWADEPDGVGGPVELRVTGDDSIIIADGDFLMNVDSVASSSTLVAEITGATHTTIKVNGNADITNGTLKVDLTGYTPVSGNSWTILTAGADITADKAAVDTIVAAAGFDPLVHDEPMATGTLIGTFATDFSLAPLTAGLNWNVSYASNSVTLSITGTPTFTADFNNDGKVDGADLTKWKQSFGGAGADANGDGVSDGADFLKWQQQFGSGVPATAAVGAVPEPASIALLGLAAMAMTAYGRSRGSLA